MRIKKSKRISRKSLLGLGAIIALLGAGYLAKNKSSNKPNPNPSTPPPNPNPTTPPPDPKPDPNPSIPPPDPKPDPNPSIPPPDPLAVEFNKKMNNFLTNTSEQLFDFVIKNKNNLQILSTQPRYNLRFLKESIEVADVIERCEEYEHEINSYNLTYDGTIINELKGKMYKIIHPIYCKFKKISEGIRGVDDKIAKFYNTTTSILLKYAKKSIELEKVPDFLKNNGCPSEFGKRKRRRKSRKSRKVKKSRKSR